MGRKRKTKSGTDSSTASQESVKKDSKIQKTSEDDEMDLTAIIVKLDKLSTQTNLGFKQLHEDFDTFKAEIKADVKAIKTVIRDLEKATEFIQNDVEDLKMNTEEEKTERTLLTNRIDSLEKQIQDLTQELKQQKDSLVNLEQYTRRENLIFNQIPESQDEDCKEKVLGVLDNMGIVSDEIKFHAVHRLGRKKEGIRPIIARFVSREDRDAVFFKRKEIKNSNPNAYITQDYARVIREERKILVRAMKHGRNQGITNIRVLDRFLYVGNEKFTFNNLPAYLKDIE